MNVIKIGHEIQIDIDRPVEHAHGQRELLLQILGQLKHNEHQQKQIMISLDSLNASATRLEAAAHTVIGLLPGTSVPSTPDSLVAQFQGRVDGASAALEAAAVPASSGGTGGAAATT